MRVAVVWLCVAGDAKDDILVSSCAAVPGRTAPAMPAHTAADTTEGGLMMAITGGILDRDGHGGYSLPLVGVVPRDYQAL